MFTITTMTMAPMSLQISFQNREINWGPPIWHDVLSESVNLKNIVHHNFGRFFGWGQFGQSYKVNHFSECLRLLKPWCTDKVHRNFRPRPGRNRKRLQQACAGSGGVLIPGTDWTRLNVLPHFQLHGRPPEPLCDGEYGPSYARMTGEQRRVSPVNHLWAQINRNIQTVLRAPTRWRGLTIRLLHLGFYVPGYQPHHTDKWKDRLGIRGNRLGAE